MNTLDTLATRDSIREFLAGCRHGVVIEDGEVTFDLADARYSVSGEHGKTLLHLWSAERNVVRRVLEIQPTRDELVLTVQRFGQAKPAKLHLRDAADTRAAAAREPARAAYRTLLRRVLERDFPDYRLERLTTAADLERSFGPVYARGVLRRGTASIAVLGVNAQEQQASVDAALTFGLLWLDQVRQSCRGFVEGLALIAPAGRVTVLRARLAWLTRGAGKLNLYELDERAGELQEVDCGDGGNIQTRLVQCPDEAAARGRFAEAITRVQRMCCGTTLNSSGTTLNSCDTINSCHSDPDPERSEGEEEESAFSCAPEVSVLSGTEISFRLRGLELARARMSVGPGSFRSATEVVFGVGPEEIVLTGETEPMLTALVRRLAASRVPGNGPQDALWRLRPERWLESLVVANVAALDARLDTRFVYSQVPAFSASDRAMIDVLTTTREGRLVVLELKADEDINLPLQGLDYWARVRWHQQRDEFHRFGYFRGRELSPQPPLLLLVAPALHIHPATDTLLRFLSREIDWELIAVDEHWREGLRVIFRKHSEKTTATD